MKLRVHFFLLLPPPLLPPCFLEHLFVFCDWGSLQELHWECTGSTQWNTSAAQTSASFLQQHKNINTCAPVRERKKICHTLKKNLLLSSGPKVSSEKPGGLSCNEKGGSCSSTGSLNTVTKLSEGHQKRDILSPIHFSFREATHNTKLIKASILRKRNVPFGEFRNSWLVLSITFVLTSVELIQLSLFMKLSFLCYLIATNCCNYISELQIFCTDKNFDCLSATHKEKITSAKWGVPRLDNNA